jgi:RNA polymerase sigma factor (sigma-70 family)
LQAWERAAARISPGVDIDDLHDRLDARAAGLVVGVALAALGARDREALTLFVWAELSYEEIAGALAIPAGTVRSRIHRARRQMRSMLSTQGPGAVATVRGEEA